MKKYLILTVTAGEGHNSVSNAIKERLEKNSNNIVKKIDIFKTYGKPSKSFFINDCYLYACKYALPLYNMVYKQLQKSNPDKRNLVPAQETVNWETPQLLKDIYLFEPDVIICSHFLCAIMITNLRRNYNIPARTIAILTDYTVHPFWEAATGIDYIVSPTKELFSQLEFKGFKKEQLLDFGLPTKEIFSSKLDKYEMRKELGINKDLFTVLVMVGGGGFGNIEKIVKQLFKVETKIQMIIINGKNEQSFKKIQALIKNSNTEHIIHNYQFVDFVAKAMAASDIIVGKCGGISTNEALNIARLTILNSKLAQQEYENMAYLTGHNCAIKMDKYNQLNDIVEELIIEPSLLNKFEEQIKKIARPNALIDLCTFAENSPTISYEKTIELNEKDFPKIRRIIKKSRLADDKNIKKQKVFKQAIQRTKIKDEKLMKTRLKKLNKSINKDK